MARESKSQRPRQSGGGANAAQAGADGAAGRTGTGQRRRRRHATDRAVRSIADRFARLVRHAPIGVVLVAEDGYAIHVNAAMRALLGYSDAELKRQPWTAWTHPEDVPETRAQVLRLLSDEVQAVQLEKRYTHKLGHVVWASTSISWLRDARGRRLCAVEHVQDITERKRTEAALRDNESKFRTLAETAAAAIFIFQGRRYCYANAAGMALTGHSRDELMAMDWWDIVDPEFRDGARRRAEARLRGEPMPVCDEVKIVTKTGETRWVEFSAAVVTYDGERAVLGTAFDITERKHVGTALRKSEQRFRETFEQAAVGIAHVALDGKWLRVNQKLCDIVGYTHEELLTRSFQDITYPEDLDADLEYVRRVLSGELHTYSMEKRYIRKDGSLVWINLTVALSRAPSGAPDYFISVVQDISQRRQAEEEVRHRQVELAHVARLSTMGEMAAALAHELNQPLGAIVSYASGCVRRIQSGRGDPRELLPAMMETSAQAVRAGEIIRRLREFVRKGATQRQPVDLNDLVQQAVGFAELEARQLQIPVRVKLADKGAVVMADAVQLEQVILNLLRNGLEAMAGTGDRPGELMLCTTLRNDAEIEVAIADQGNGLPADMYERAFEPFVSTKPNGLGMGLPISRSIVRAHGGQLWATPNGDRGTTFRFTLPTCSGG